MNATEFALLAREDLEVRADYWRRIAEQATRAGQTEKARGAWALCDMARERAEQGKRVH